MLTLLGDCVHCFFFFLNLKITPFVRGKSFVFFTYIFLWNFIILSKYLCEIKILFVITIILLTVQLVIIVANIYQLLIIWKSPNWNIRYVLSLYLTTIKQYRTYCYHYLMDKKTETQKGKVIYTIKLTCGGKRVATMVFWLPNWTLYPMNHAITWRWKVIFFNFESPTQHNSKPAIDI